MIINLGGGGGAKGEGGRRPLVIGQINLIWTL